MGREELGAGLEHLIDRRVRMAGVGDGGVVALDEVLQESDVVIAQPERRVEATGHTIPILVVEALGIDTGELQHDAEIAALRQEDPVVEEGVELDQRVQGAGLAVGLMHAPERQHRGDSCERRAERG